MEILTNEPFLKHLNVQKTHHVIVTAEDAEFDDEFLQDLRDEGFNVAYLAQEELKPKAFASKLHALANEITGVSERYAIVGMLCFLLSLHAFI
jgi:post-segregation antitoxin (ccd killing protein)